MYHAYKEIHKSQGFILIFFSHKVITSQYPDVIWNQEAECHQNPRRLLISLSPSYSLKILWWHWTLGLFFAIRNVDSFENGFLSCGLIFTLRDFLFLVHSAGGWFSSWEGDFWLAWHSRRWPWLQQSPPATVSCPLPTRLNAHVS